jgi:small subunit ribosomal protein S21
MSSSFCQDGLSQSWRNDAIRLEFLEIGAKGAVEDVAVRRSDSLFMFGFGDPFGSFRPFFDLECDQFMQIIVRDNNVDQALRALKKKLQREGVYREMKLRRHYEKPSEKRAREKAAAVRRARKMDRKRMERDGVK